MSKYKLFQIPPLSFYSIELYKHMALNKKGVGFGYLFLLLAVCWLLLTFSMDYQIDSYLDKYAPGLISQFPTVTVINGHAFIEEQQPYFIHDPETSEVIAVIDTTGSINSLDSSDASILLTRTSVIFKKSDVETRSFDLSDIVEFELNQDMLTQWVDMTKSYLSIAVYPFALAGSYVYRIIQMLIYALIGLIFASILKVELDYPQLLRLSVVAVTPCIIINTLFWTFGANLPFEGLLYFILTMGYLFLGIKVTGEAIREQSSE